MPALYYYKSLESSAGMNYKKINRLSQILGWFSERPNSFLKVPQRRSNLATLKYMYECEKHALKLSMISKLSMLES